MIHFFAGPRRSIKDYMEKPGNGLGPVKKRNYGSLVTSLPNQLYTSKECLSEIKRRDKDANVDYVNEYLKDVQGMGKGRGKSS